MNAIELRRDLRCSRNIINESRQSAAPETQLAEESHKVLLSPQLPSPISFFSKFLHKRHTTELLSGTLITHIRNQRSSPSRLHNFSLTNWRILTAS